MGQLTKMGQSPNLMGWDKSIGGLSAHLSWTGPPVWSLTHVGRASTQTAGLHAHGTNFVPLHATPRGRRWCTVIFRVWREVYLLAPLGRGDRGDDFCHGGVVNGGLWWPEEASEDARFGLLSSGLSPFLRLSSCWDVWRGVEATGGDVGRYRWMNGGPSRLAERDEGESCFWF